MKEHIKKFISLILLIAFSLNMLLPPINSIAKSIETENEIINDEEKIPPKQKDDLNSNQEPTNNEPDIIPTPEDDANQDDSPNIELDKTEITVLAVDENDKVIFKNSKKELPPTEMTIKDIIDNTLNTDDINKLNNYKILKYKVDDIVYENNSDEIDFSQGTGLEKSFTLKIICKEKVKPNVKLNLKFTFNDIVHKDDSNEDLLIEKTITLKVPENFDNDIIINGKKDESLLSISTFYIDENDEKIEIKENFKNEHYTLLEDVNKSITKDNITNLDVINIKTEKISGNYINLNNEYNDNNIKVYLENLNTLKINNENFDIQENNPIEIKVLNRKDNLDNNFNKDLIYYNDDLNIELKENFISHLLDNDNNKYDFDYYEDGTKKELDKKDLNFNLKNNSFKTINYDEKRYLVKINHDFEDSNKIETNLYLTKDIILKLKEINIKGYELENKEALDDKIDFSDFKDNDFEVNLNYIKNSEIKEGINLPSTEEELLRDFNIYNTLVSSSLYEDNTKARKFKGYLNSQIEVHPITKHDYVGDYSNDKSNYIYQYGYKLADNSEKTIDLTSSNNIPFKFIDNSLVMYTVSYINKSNKDKKIIPNQYYYEPSGRTMKIPASNFFDKGLKLTSGTFDKLEEFDKCEIDKYGNECYYYNISNNSIDQNITFEYEKFETVGYNILNFTIGFFRHDKECEMSSGDSPIYKDKTCDERCIYFTEDGLENNFYNIILPIPELTEEIITVEFPIMTKIGAGYLKQYTINNDALKSKDNLPPIIEIEELKDEDNIYSGVTSDEKLLKVKINLNKERFEDFQKTKLDKKYRDYPDIDVFYKLQDGVPEELPKLLKDIEINHLAVNEKDYDKKNSKLNNDNFDILKKETFQALAGTDISINRLKFENTSSNYYRFIDKDLKNEEDIEIKNNTSDSFNKTIEIEDNDIKVNWYFYYKENGSSELPKNIKVVLSHRYLDQDKIFEKYHLKWINFLLTPIEDNQNPYNISEENLIYLNDIRKEISNTGIGSNTILTKSIYTITKDIKKIVENIDMNNLTEEEKTKISNIKNFDFDKIDFEGKDFTLERDIAQGEFRQGGEFCLSPNILLKNFNNMYIDKNINNKTYRYYYEYEPLENANDKCYKLDSANKEDTITLPVKYIRKLTHIEEIIDNSNKKGSYKIRYICNGIEKNGKIEDLTSKDLNKITGEYVYLNGQNAKIISSIESSLNPGTKFKMKPYNFEKYKFYNKNYNEEKIIEIKNNTTKTIDFYYYIKEGEDPKPINKAGYIVNFLEYNKEFNEESTINNKDIKDFSQIKEITPVYKNNFLEGVPSDLEKALNLEKDNYFILKFNENTSEDINISKNLLRFDKYLDSEYFEELKPFFEKQILSLFANENNAINLKNNISFYYIKLDNPYKYNVEYRDFDTNLKISKTKYEVLENNKNIKDIKSLVDNGTEMAININDYKNIESKTKYDNSTNTITFYYTNPIKYNIKFIDINTKEEISEEISNNEFYDLILNLKSKNLNSKGYKLVSIKDNENIENINIKYNEDYSKDINRDIIYKYNIENKKAYPIVFYYNKLKYNITHIDKDTNKNLDNLVSIETNNIDYNEEINRKSIDIKNYTSITKPINISIKDFINEKGYFLEENPTFDYFYKKDLKYKVIYIDNDTEEELHNSKSSSLKSYDQVKEEAVDISSYNKLDPTSQIIKRSDYFKINSDGSKDYIKDEILLIFKYERIPSKKRRPKKDIEVKEEIKRPAMLNRDDHFEYIQGYPDNSVRPEGNITREEVSAVFYRLLDKEYKQSIYTLKNNFNDINSSKWSNKHISTLAKGNIVKGYEDNTFKSENFITRAEAAAIASRFDNLESINHNFSDISGHWAEKYIGSAHNKGWIKGYEDGTFKPDEYITRAEFVTLVNNVLNRGVLYENILDGIKEFKDLDKDQWYYEAMVEAINGHIFKWENNIEIWQKLEDFNFDM